MRKPKTIRVGIQVQVPAFVVMPHRVGLSRYQWQFGIVRQVGVNKRGERVAKVEYGAYGYKRKELGIFQHHSLYSISEPTKKRVEYQEFCKLFRLK